jgi:hypothetical protein
MRNVLLKVFIVGAVTAIGIFGADNSIGTWKRNIEKSKVTPPNKNPVTSLTLVNMAVDGGVKQTSTGQRKDGTAIDGSFTAKYDGKEYPVIGAAYDTISIKQIDANTFTLETKKTGGKFHTTSRMVISKDGKTMTLTLTGTNADGERVKSTYLYDKQ